MNRFSRGIFLVSRFAAVQTVAQGLGFVAGFILVRALDKHNYALYTLSITGINALAILSESGVIDAGTAIAGRCWQDPHQLGQVIASATRFRNRLAIVVFPPIVVVLDWLLHANGASTGEIAVITGAACLAAYLQVSTSILSVALRIKSQIRHLQNLDLVGSLLRAALVICFFLILDAELAILLLVASTGAMLALARRWAAPTIDRTVQPNSGMLVQIRSVVRRQWLSGLAFVLQGQITVLLLGVFGGSETVADFGALGRIAAVFSIIGAIAQSIILPYYTRCQDPNDMLKLYGGILSSFIAVAALPVLVTAALPQPLLWILGAKYGRLDHELLLVTLSASTAFIAYTAWGLNSVRAWIIPAWLNVPFLLGSQFASMAIIGVSTMDQMLWVGIVVNVLSALLSMAATLIFSKGFSRV